MERAIAEDGSETSRYESNNNPRFQRHFLRVSSDIGFQKSFFLFRCARVVQYLNSKIKDELKCFRKLQMLSLARFTALETLYI